MAGKGVSAANDTGLWGADSTGTLRLLLRGGSLVNGKKIRSFVVLGTVHTSPGQTRSFNRTGEVVARLLHAYSQRAKGPFWRT